MIVKRMDKVLRENGFFIYQKHNETIKVPAAHPGDGVGVVVVFEPSQLDRDFGTRFFYPQKAELYWFPHDCDLKRIQTMMDKSDKETFEMRGKGWNGPKPYHELQEFI